MSSREQDHRTELFEKLEQLTESRKQRLDMAEKLVNTAPGIMYAKDEGGVYRMVNQAFADALGLAVDEVVGRRLEDLIDDSHAIAQSNEAERGVVDSGERHPTRMETFRTVDGARHYYRIRRIPFRLNGDKLVVGAASDLTPQIRCNGMWQGVIDQTGAAVVSACNEVITYWSPGAARLLGWAAEDVRGEMLGRVFSPGVASALLDPASHGTSLNEEAETRDGQRLLITIHPHHWQDEAATWLAALMESAT